MNIRFKILINSCIATIVGIMWLLSLMYIPGLESRYGILHPLSQFISQTASSFIIKGLLSQIITSIVPSAICAFLISFLRPKRLLLYSASVVLPFVVLITYLIATLEPAMSYYYVVIGMVISIAVPLALIPTLLFIFYRVQRS